MGRNIVIFSDGTGQEGGKGFNTNVYKLFNMIENRSERQIAWYDPGIGTDWRKIAGSITGMGFSENLIECYRFIFENYARGDEIFLFGFSRGAATMRSLSAFLTLFGILPKARPDLIKHAYKIYKIKDKEKLKKEVDEFRSKHHTLDISVKFLGVWDTVAALGLPMKWVSVMLDPFIPHQFHDFKLCDGVEYARQALSIDDERKTFHPLLWDPLPESEPNDRMKQVWFCGVHTDVGGGYKEEELSNITLKWMVKEAEAKGLIIDKNSLAYKKLISSTPDVDGVMHNELKRFPGMLFRRLRRNWDKTTHGEPMVHQSVLLRKKNIDNEEMPAYKAWLADLMDKDKPWIEPWDDTQSDSEQKKAA